MGRVEGVIDDGADRCAVGVGGVHCQRGGCASSSVVGSFGHSSSNGRTYDGSHADHVLSTCQEHVILARVVVYDTMIWAVVVVMWLPGMRSMASGAT